MVITLNDLSKVLKQHFLKVSYEEQSDYYLVVLRDDKREFVLCVSRNTGGYIYGKIIDLEKTGSFDCNDIVYYNPNGLYVFARSLDEFINKLIGKARAMKQE